MNYQKLNMLWNDYYSGRHAALYEIEQQIRSYARDRAHRVGSRYRSRGLNIFDDDLLSRYYGCLWKMTRRKIPNKNNVTIMLLMFRAAEKDALEAALMKKRSACLQLSLDRTFSNDKGETVTLADILPCDYPFEDDVHAEMIKKEALDRLAQRNERYKKIICLMLDGYSPREISSELNITYDNARRLQQRALEAFRKILQEMLVA